MNKRTLMEFIQHIIENSSLSKTQFALGELKNILQTQQASPELIQIIQMAQDSVPELMDEKGKGPLNDETLAILHERAKARIAREEAARSYGRC